MKKFNEGLTIEVYNEEFLKALTKEAKQMIREIVTNKYIKFSKKGRMILKMLLKKQPNDGWVLLGSGTNRVAIQNKYGTVIKIGIDGCGRRDNMNELLVAQATSQFDVTPTYHTTSDGTFSHVECDKTFNFFKYMMFRRRDEINSRLNNLSTIFLLSDVGPGTFDNWGESYTGKMRSIDAAYLKAIDGLMDNIKCNCGSDAITYDTNLNNFICLDCGNKITYSQLDFCDNTKIQEEFDRYFIDSVSRL